MKNNIKQFLRVERQSAALRRAKKRADREINFGLDDTKRAIACDKVARHCEVEMRIIERNQQIQTQQFSGTQAIWQQEHSTSIPYANTKQSRDARLYWRAGVAVLSMEGYVSAYVLRASGYDWFTTILVSGIVTTLLAWFAHGLIKLITERENPRESAMLIRKWICLPSIIVTLPSLALFLFVRVFSGGETSGMPAEGGWFGWLSVFDFVLYVVSSVFDFALWVATLGLVPLGAGLLLLSEIYGWSTRASEGYEEAIRRYAELKILQAEYEALRTKKRPPQPPTKPLPPSTNSLQGLLLPALLAFGLATGLTACHQPQPTLAAGSKAIPEATVLSDTTPTTSVAIQVKIDQSGSITTEAAELAARTLHRQLPSIIPALNADSLDVSTFTDHGWHTKELWAQRLPRMPVLKVPKIEGGKLPPHVIEQIKRRNEAQLVVARQQAEKKYQEDLKEALAGLDVKALNATTKTKAKCTDLLGVLSRIGETEEPGQQVYLIITDGYSSCKQKAPITAPKGNVTVLVMLATAVASESGGLSDTDQYYTRREALLKVAPWLIIVPADEGDLIHKLTKKPALATAKAEQP